jgi:hypothetical protein
VPRLKKSRAIPLLPLWASMTWYNVSFTSVNVLVNQDSWIIQSWIKQFSLHICM